MYIAEGGYEMWADLEGSITSAGNYLLMRVKEDFPVYQWVRNALPIPGATFKYFQAIIDGTHSVSVESVEGCPGDSDTHFISVDSTPGCFVRLLKPVQDSKNIPVNTELVFDVRFNYIISGGGLPPLDTINVSITDGGSPVMTIKGRPSGHNITIYEPGEPMGTESGYRYIVNGIRFRGGTTVRIDVVI
jgi:hypothetical protein